MAWTNPSRHETEEITRLISIVSYLSGITVFDFLMTLILKMIVSCVLSGSVVSGRKVSLVPAVPLSLEAEVLFFNVVKLT